MRPADDAWADVDESGEDDSAEDASRPGRRVRVSRWLRLESPRWPQYHIRNRLSVAAAASRRPSSSLPDGQEGQHAGAEDDDLDGQPLRVGQAARGLGGHEEAPDA